MSDKVSSVDKARDGESKLSRKVCFPRDDQLVTQYFEPANPWEDVPNTTRAQLAAEYLESCRCHRTPPIDSVLQQIRELPENTIGGCTRAPRLALTDCSLLGTAPTDALEALLRKVQFRRLEIVNAGIDDEGAEALFDMIEYYESATAISIIGPRHFGIRGWQAASRMIKKSSEITELEIGEDSIEATHAPVLVRALRPAACRLRCLTLRRACLAGESLLCLVIALKTNTSIRELRLGDNGLTPSDASQIGALLRYNTRLQLLDLSNNQIQDSGVGVIADALVDQAAHSPPSPSNTPILSCVPGYETRGLAFLVLWNNQLTRNCANHLAKVLRTTQSLCVLNIGRNSLGAEVVKALQTERTGPLISLGLQAARISPDAKAVAQLIRTSRGLQRLDLRDNKIGVAGLQAILSALKENNTLTQIDLDDPPESSPNPQSCTEGATMSRLLQDIRALCLQNCPTAPPDTLMRKISLTCHTHHTIKNTHTEEERKGRLRSPAPSPAPSPAGSPVPAPSRFSVSPVTPDRVPDSPSVSRTYCPTPSRFKVVQVAEPPQIQVHQAPRKSASRFSVTRNYDTIYNPILPPTSPSPSPSPSPDISETKHDSLTDSDQHKFDYKAVKVCTAGDDDRIDVRRNEKVKSDDVLVDDVFEAETDVTFDKSHVDDKIDKKKIETAAFDGNNGKIIDNKEKVLDISDVKERDKHTNVHSNVNKTAGAKEPEYVVSKTVVIPKTEIRNVVTQTEEIMTDFIIQVEVHDEVREVKSEITEVCFKSNGKTKETQSVIIGPEQKFVLGPEVSEVSKIQLEIDKVSNESVNSDVRSANVSLNNENISELGKTSDVTDNNSDKIDLSHNETIDYATDTKIGKTLDVSDTDKIKTEYTTKVHRDQIVNIIADKREDVAINRIEGIAHSLSSKRTLDIDNIVPVRDSVVLKKNKSESSLDSPDLEVSRLMRKPVSAFCDSSSSLEVSGSSVESLNESRSRTITNDQTRSISKESSVESTSDVTPVNLNISISSNESVSPIIFGMKKLHGSISSLEASVSSVDSAKQDKLMVTSADSGIEYSLQNPSDIREDSSSNEGTLTCSSSLRESVKKDQQETLTSPKRTSSLLDVPALKSKGLDRMRKISWVAPSPSFNLIKPEEKIEYKLPTNLEKLLSLFHHPSSLFSRSSSDDEKKSTSSTPPRKDSSLTSSFWSWGTVADKNDKEDTDSLSEATDSTLSERVQVSYVDESFSKKLDSKTPSTDTDTLSEFQFPTNSAESAKVTEISTDELVQKLALSDKTTDAPESDKTDLIMPNELKVYDEESGDKSDVKPDGGGEAASVKLDDKPTDARPRSFASVLKSNSGNSLEKQTSPETAQPVDKLPTKVIRGIKENISPENTLTSSIATTALAMQVMEREVKSKSAWDVVEKIEEKPTDKAPIANIDETCDMAADLIQLHYIDEKIEELDKKEVESVDLGKDALSYLMYENQEFGSTSTDKQESLAQELRDAEIKEMLDLSPELVIDEAVEIPEVFTVEIKGRKSSPVIPERAKIKKSNSLEDLSKRPVLQEKESPKLKTIAFKVPESTTPRDIPERRSKLRTRSGSSPKSLPESLNKPCPLAKMDLIMSKKKKKVSSLGKMARDSLLALNMSEDEIAEFRRSYKLTSVESLRSLESVSEDANSQSGTSVDSRCKACLRTSQESLMSLDSITEDCRCIEDCEKRQNR